MFILVGCQHNIYIYIHMYCNTLNRSGGVIIFVGGEVLVVVFVVLVLVLVVLGVVLVIVEVVASHYCY